jgi:hypothetical protein
MSKGTLLAELKPLIFFDDSPKNCADAAVTTPTVRIPVEDTVSFMFTLPPAPVYPPRQPERFLHVCKLVLKKTFDQHEPALLAWQEQKLAGMSDEAFHNFTGELERRAKGTPAGRQRRAAGAKNEDFIKLMQFLENAVRKYS